MRSQLFNIALLLLMLLFAVALVAHAAAPATAQPTAAPSTAGKPPADAPPVHEVDPVIAAFMKPVEIAQGDDELRQKMKQRHNTAVRLLELRIDSYRKGVSDVSGVFEAAREVADADRDLAQSP